jgi:hypothetical protein
MSFRHALTSFTLASTLLAPSGLGAQVMRYGVVMDNARNAMAGTWTEDIHQVERVYCVTRWWAAAPHARPIAADSADGRQADTVFRVLQVQALDVVDATPNGATFVCPAGQPELHTHPPATCYEDRVDQCYAGGPDAYSCQPSRADVRTLKDRGDEFAIVQCDRNAFVFYYPSEFDAPTPAPAPTPALAVARIRDPYVNKP